MKVTIEFDNSDEAVDALDLLWKYQSIITEVLNFTSNKFKRTDHVRISSLEVRRNLRAGRPPIY